MSLVLTYQGQQQVEQGPEFRYLPGPVGLDLHQSKGFTSCTSHLLAAAQKALFGLKQKCMQLHITDARLQCSLSDTLVIPGWLSVYTDKTCFVHFGKSRLNIPDASAGQSLHSAVAHERMAASQCFMFEIRSVLSQRNEIG